MKSKVIERPRRTSHIYAVLPALLARTGRTSQRRGLALVALTAVLAGSARAQWTVTNLHPAGATYSQISSVSGGQQVGYATIGGSNRASLWTGTAGSWVDLTPVGATSSYSFAVRGGKQVGYSLVGGENRASLWSGTPGSWVDLGPGYANGVDGNQQVGWSGGHASIWTGTAASRIDLNPVGTNDSYAFAIQGGQQVGRMFAGAFRASLWTGTAASWVDLSPAGTTGSFLWGVHSGQQVGWAYVGGNQHAGLWTGSATSWLDLHPASAEESQAYGVSNGVQVGYALIGGTYRASLWSGTAASRVDLHPLGYSSSYARSIAQAGSITYVGGRGRNTATGQEEALLWVYSNITVGGQIHFNDYEGSTISSALIEYKDASFVVQHSEVAPIDGSGNFTVPPPPTPGNYFVSVQARSWLRSTVGPVDTHASVSGLVFDLINGDIDVDNEVGIGDYSQLSAAYGSFPGRANWNSAADLNGDEAIDIADYAILSANYGLVGDD